MNSHELRKNITMLVNGWCGEPRQCVVTVSRGAYGRPSMATIEWQGSPPHLQICINLSNSRDSALLIAGKLLRPNYRNARSKHAIATDLIMNWLEASGHLDGVYPSKPLIRDNAELLEAYDHLSARAEQLYKASQMFVGGRIDMDAFYSYINSKVDFNELCQLANESDESLEF